MQREDMEKAFYHLGLKRPCDETLKIIADNEVMDITEYFTEHIKHCEQCMEAFKQFDQILENMLDDYFCGHIHDN